MKKIIFGFVFLLAVILSAKTTIPTMVDYADSKRSFTCKVPSTWERSEELTGFYLNNNSFGFGQASGVMRPYLNEDEEEHDTPGSTIYRENMVTVVRTLSSSLRTDIFAKEYLESLKATNGKTSCITVTQILKAGKLKAGVSQADYIIFDFKACDVSNKLKAITFLYVKGSKGYAVTCGSIEKRFDEYSPIFFEIGKSFSPE